MNDILIIPETQEIVPEGKLGKFDFVYLHGKLEDDCGYDIFTILNPEKHGFKTNKNDIFIVFDHNQEGTHSCIYNEKKCTLFLWSYRDRYKGLVVYDDDLESVEYAKMCFEKRTQII